MVKPRFEKLEKQLSPQQLAVWRMSLEGKNGNQIAKALGITRQRVSQHHARIRQFAADSVQPDPVYAAQVYAVLIVDAYGNESLAWGNVAGREQPLVAVDEETLRSMMPAAQAVANGTGQRLLAVEFTGRGKIVRRIKPE